jgi:acyl-homoserine-lactone acylase
MTVSFRRTRAVLPILLAMLVAIFMGACERSDTPPTTPPARFSADVARTTHGIAHIRAKDFLGLGYGLAYAYAEDNLCMFADSLLTARGERARFFGADARATVSRNGEYGAASDFMDLSNEDSDFFFKAYLDIEQLKAGYAKATQASRDLLEGYAAGYNRYLKDHAGRFPEACKGASWVRDITVDDVYLVLAEKALHATGEVFAQEIVNAARDTSMTMAPVKRQAARKLDGRFMQERLARLTREQLGSNGLAIGRQYSSNERGVLLGNPHYPWTSTDRFYQAHLTVPGSYDAMGVVLGGIPIVVIGFNKDVAWTHTVTSAVHFTTFRLTLDPADASGTTYLSDGVRVRMSSKTVTVDSLQPDGSLKKRSKTFWFSEHGAVMVKPDAGLAWTRDAVFVLGDPNRNNTRMIDQWLGIGRAGSVAALKSSLDKVVGLPWINTIAADRNGDVLYADASVVPNVSPARFGSSCMLFPPLLALDGALKDCGWAIDAGAPAGIIAPANGPWMMRSDYVGNSNDSYWVTNPKALLTGPSPAGFSPLYGRTGVEQRLRTRIGFRQLEDMIAQKRTLDPGDVQSLAFANRVYAAELVLPEFLPHCFADPDPALAPACSILTAWDRRANLDSRGAVLFREFWNAASAIPDKWAVPLDASDPVNTPRGMRAAVAPQMLAALRAAIQKLQAMNIPIDARLGDYQSETRNGIRTELHGAIGDIDGSYNSIHLRTPLQADGYRDITWGTSYVQVVGFDAGGPVARAMLVYGQSVDPKSPYYADQLPLYSRKQWHELPFTEARIKGDPAYRMITLSQ